MIEFKHKGKTLAYMPRVDATMEQVKACRMIVADKHSLNLYNVRLKLENQGV